MPSHMMPSHMMPGHGARAKKTTADRAATRRDLCLAYPGWEFAALDTQPPGTRIADKLAMGMVDEDNESWLLVTGRR